MRVTISTMVNLPLSVTPPMRSFIRVNYGIKQTYAMPQLYQNRCDK